VRREPFRYDSKYSNASASEEKLSWKYGMFRLECEWLGRHGVKLGDAERLRHWKAAARVLLEAGRSGGGGEEGKQERLLQYSFLKDVAEKNRIGADLSDGDAARWQAQLRAFEVCERDRVKKRRKFR